MSTAPRLARLAIQQPDINAVIGGITFENGTKLTSNQISDLLSIRYSNGQPVITLQDRDILYEMMNLINKIGWEEGYRYLVQSTFPDKTSVILENPLLQKERQQLYADMENYRNRPITGKGAYKCGKCGSEETISAEKQTRSADEPMTVHVTCTACNNRWRVQ